MKKLTDFLATAEKVSGKTTATLNQIKALNPVKTTAGLKATPISPEPELKKYGCEISLSIVVEGIPEPIPVTSYIVETQIIKAFERATTPYIQITFGLHDSVAALIEGVPPQQIKFLFSLKQYELETNRMIETDIGYDKTLYGKLMLEANEIPKFPNPNKLPEDSHFVGAEANTDGNAIGMDNFRNVTLQLFATHDRNRETHEGHYRAKLKDIIGNLLKDVRANGRLVIGKFAAHCDEISENITIPPLSRNEALKYLAKNYGIFQNGLRLFNDFSTMFMMDPVNPVTSESNKVLIELANDTEYDIVGCYDIPGVHVVRCSADVTATKTNSVQGILNVLGDQIRIVNDGVENLGKMICLDITDELKKLTGIRWSGFASTQGPKVRYLRANRKNPCIGSSEITRILTSLDRPAYILPSCNLNLIRANTIFKLRSLVPEYPVNEEQEYMIAELRILISGRRGPAKVGIELYPINVRTA